MDDRIRGVIEDLLVMEESISGQLRECESAMEALRKKMAALEDSLQATVGAREKAEDLLTLVSGLPRVATSMETPQTDQEAPRVPKAHETEAQETEAQKSSPKKSWTSVVVAKSRKKARKKRDRDHLKEVHVSGVMAFDGAEKPEHL